VNVSDLVKKHEGLRLTPYQCTEGFWTIGYGHNLDAHGEPVPEIITLAQAEDLFEMDLAVAVVQCEDLFPNWADIDEVRQAVLIDMCFNLGKQRLWKFFRMREAIGSRDWGQAAIQMEHSAWAWQTGHRAQEDIEMMRSGEWPKGQKQGVSG